MSTSERATRPAPTTRTRPRASALEELRSRLRGEELKIAFVGNKLEVYERLIELCLERLPDPGGFDEIFSYIEQAKSRALLDLIRSRCTAWRAPTPPTRR